MENEKKFEMPKYSNPEVAGCMALVDFVALIPMMPTCGGPLMAV